MPRLSFAVLRVVFAFAAFVGMARFGVPSASADDLTDFEHARSLYVKRNYQGAASELKQLVGTEPPRVTERLLILESRKYLAASLLFLGQRAEARAQFRLLLAQEPNYTLDPLAFPTEVVSLFDHVKRELTAQVDEARAQEQLRREEEQRLAQERARVERENLERLFKLAEESETLQKNSRWIATIPFGVGQFQNGDKNFGVALAVLEALAAAGSVATFIGHQSIAHDRPAQSNVRETQRIEQLWRTSNNACFGVFAVLALVGIIDAHVRFVPGRVTSHKRALPPDLKRWMEQHKLSASASGLTLQF